MTRNKVVDAICYNLRISKAENKEYIRYESLSKCIDSTKTCINKGFPRKEKF